MRICQIVPSLDARHGGPSRSVLQLARALADAGEAVELLATADHPTPSTAAPGLNVQYFQRAFPTAICRAPHLANRLSAGRYQIVHHHALWLRTLHYAANATRHQPNARLVISPRGMMSPWAWQHHRTRKHWASRFIHPGAFQQAAGWHATSEAEVDDIRRLGLSQPICLAPNGVALPTVGELETARLYWQQVCPDIGHRRVALFYSRFHRKKRVLELIELWQRQAPRDWLLLLVGIPEEFSLEELTAHAQRHPRASIRVCSGENAPSPYAVAELLVLPSHSENFGMVIAEAMAAGVPVAVTDTTPWSEINRHSCGWCVPWDEFPAALAAALGEAPSSLQIRGQRAQAWVSTEFSWGKSAHTLIEFYAQLRPGPA